MLSDSKITEPRNFQNQYAAYNIMEKKAICKCVQNELAIEPRM
jgi:hypothetical protein